MASLELSAGAGAARRWGRPPAWALLLIAAAVLMGPTLVLGAGFSHSASCNHIWVSQFTDALLGGQPYPRWLPDVNEGLGSPAFYFYPPLAFHLAALVDLPFGGALPVHHQIAVASTILLFGSGLAMHAWLRGQVDARWAAIGALAYQAAPYHLLDHYVRGAFAEFAAFVFLPLVALGLRRVAEGCRRGAILLPIGYAGLILAHLPVALLVSVTLVPAYVLYLAVCGFSDLKARVSFLVRAALLGTAGLCLTAPYLAPALSLGDFISSERLWTSYYQPFRWFLTRSADWPNATFMTAIAFLAAGAAVLCLGVAMAVLRTRRSGADAADLREALFWAGAGGLSLALLAGLAPFFWSLPLIDKVQFPWRLLTVVEFCAVTAAVLVMARTSARGFALWGGAAGLAALPGVALSAMMAAQLLYVTQQDAGAARRAWSTELRDVDEYLPAGFFPDAEAVSEAQRNRPLVELRGRPLAIVAGDASAKVQAREQDHALEVTVRSSRPVMVAVRSFYFPSWKVSDAGGRVLEARAQGPHRLLSWMAPPGVTTYRVEQTSLPVERAGWAVCLLTALGLGALQFRADRLRGKATTA